MSDVLVGSGRSGDFVHANQVMASDVGFKNVAKIWYNQTISFDDGIKSVEEIKAGREDIVESIGDAVIKNDGNKVLVMIDGREFAPTQHALCQLGTWCDTPHTLLNTYSKPKLNVKGEVKYNRDDRDADLIVRALRLGQSRVADKSKEMLFRTYNDGTLRAVLSDRYAIIDNRWYLETLKQAIPEGRLSHWRGDADTLWGNVLIPDTLRADKDSEYGGMLSLANCEIGLRRLAQWPSVFRAICMNGCIWDRKSGKQFTQIHRGEINLDDLRTEIFDNLNRQIPLMTDHVTRFLSMRDRKLSTKMSRLIACFATDNKFSPTQAMEVIDQFAEYEKSDRNAFGLINAVTRAGQKFDNETWFNFDNAAGSLVKMTDGQWESFNKRADAMDDESVAAAFAVAA